MLLVSLAIAQDGVRLPFLNGSTVLATITLHQNAQGKYVDTAEVLPALQAVVDDASFAMLTQTATSQPEWPLGETRGGVTLSFDTRQVAVAVTVTNPRPVKLGLRGAGTTPLGRIVSPSGVSAYANIYAGTGYTSGASAANGRMPTSMQVDAAINRNNWVMESHADYASRENHPLDIQDTRLVRDVPDKMMRYQAGELSYPTTSFQRFTQLLGMGGARNFDLQPYRITRPAGQSGFTLSTPATVDVLVNNVKVKTLQLQPGVYELSDFPVASGSNNVKLIITDSSGRREEKDLPVVSDSNLLEKDLSEFTYNLGVPVTDNSHAADFQFSRPTFAGMWRKGLTGNTTVGANLQTSLKEQLVGLEQVVATKLGLFHGEAAVSRNGGATGQGARLEYHNLPGADADGNGTDFWQASLLFQSRQFNLDDDQPDNPYSVEAQAGYNHAFNSNLTGSLRGIYRFSRGTTGDDYTTGGSLYYRLNTNWWASLDGARSLRSGDTLLATLSWNPKATQQITTSYDMPNQQWRTDWSMRPDMYNMGFDSTAELTKKNDTYQLNGNTSYTGQRGTVGFRQDRTMDLAPGSNTVMQPGTTTQFNAATALVYADGMAAIGRPVTDSFAIVQPVVSNTTARVNPMQDAKGNDVYQAQSDWLGPAVISDLVPYTYRNLDTDVMPGQNFAMLQRSALVLFPTYKSGTAVVAGTLPPLVVIGTLVDADGKPLALAAGHLARRVGNPPHLQDIEPSAGPATVNTGPDTNLVFTNREGHFRIDGLKPGAYAIRLASETADNLSVAFDIPTTATGALNLGNLQVAALTDRQVTTLAAAISSTTPSSATP